MYHPTLPVPSEIEAKILNESDAQGIFSYLTSNVDTYQRALQPSFWYTFDHYKYQEVFEEAVKYKSYELIKSMMDNYQIDSIVLLKAKDKFLTGGDYEGMILFGVIDGKLKMEELSKALLDRDMDRIWDHIDYLDAVMINFPIEKLKWAFVPTTPYEPELAERIMGALIRVGRIPEFKPLQAEFVIKVDRFLSTRRGNQYFEGTPFAISILENATEQTYEELVGEYEDPIAFYYDTRRFPMFQLISDPDIYMRVYRAFMEHPYSDTYSREIMDDNYFYLLTLGFVLKPWDWLQLTWDLSIEEFEKILTKVIDNAYSNGYEYFAKYLSNLN